MSEPDGPGGEVLPAAGETAKASPMTETSHATEPTPAARLKDLILERAKALGGVTISIDYDGAGDEGNIGDIILFDRDPRTTPNATPNEIDIRSGYGLRCGDTVFATLAEAIDHLGWQLLDDHHGGFEIDEGGYGTIWIDIATGRTVIEKTDRFISETTETVEV